MTINFACTVKEPAFLDPRQNFEQIKLTIEIRYDPLTGRASRIFPFRSMALSRHDWTPFVEESKQKFCPFCPQVIEQVTPKFTADIAPEGRIKVGGAVAIPNLNPYEKHASIVIMSPKHYIAMADMDIDTMVDSFQVGLTYLKRVAQADPVEGSYPTINWNYMPYAGGSLIHPHLHVLSGARPSTYHEQLIQASTAYHNRHQSNYWADLITSEKQAQKRYIGRQGSVHWLAAFAPRHIAEVVGIIPGKQTIDDINQDDLVALAQGLQKIIAYYDQCNLPAFNAALYFAPRQDQGFNVHIRTVGRFTIYPLVGSDVTHMQILHDDPWTVMLPEDVAKSLRTVFNP